MSTDAGNHENDKEKSSLWHRFRAHIKENLAQGVVIAAMVVTAAGTFIKGIIDRAGEARENEIYNEYTASDEGKGRSLVPASPTFRIKDGEKEVLCQYVRREESNLESPLVKVPDGMRIKLVEEGVLINDQIFPYNRKEKQKENYIRIFLMGRDSVVELGEIEGKVKPDSFGVEVSGPGKLDFGKKAPKNWCVGIIGKDDPHITMALSENSRVETTDRGINFRNGTYSVFKCLFNGENLVIIRNVDTYFSLGEKNLKTAIDEIRFKDSKETGIFNINGKEVIGPQSLEVLKQKLENRHKEKPIPPKEEPKRDRVSWIDKSVVRGKGREL